MSHTPKNENQSPETSPAVAGVKTSTVAARWQVTQRTVQRWLKRLGPEVVSDETALAAALIKDLKCPADVRRIASGILTIEAIKPGLVDATADPQATAGDLRTRLGGINRQLAWVESRLEEAKSETNSANVVLYLRLFRELQAAAVANEVTQSKLGIDTGALISRAEFERLIKAMGTRLALGIQRVRDQLAPDLLKLDRPADAAARLEPGLIIVGLLDPMAAAANLAAGCGLPDWAVKIFRESCGDLVEQGEAQLEARRKVIPDMSEKTVASQRGETAEKGDI